MSHQVRLTKELWPVEEFARHLFLDDPHLSIDEAARCVINHDKRGLGKDMLSKIRMKVREHINHSMGTDMTQTATNQSSTFSNHPRVVEKLKAVPGLPVAADDYERSAEMGTDGKPMARRPKVDSITKKKWFDDWALKNPWSTINEARDALVQQFGEGVGTNYLADTLKASRALAQEASREKQKARDGVPAQTIAAPGSGPIIPSIHTGDRVPFGDVVKEIVAAMTNYGIKSIKRNDDNTVELETVFLVV